MSEANPLSALLSAGNGILAAAFLVFAAVMFAARRQEIFARSPGRQRGLLGMTLLFVVLAAERGYSAYLRSTGILIASGDVTDRTELYLVVGIRVALAVIAWSVLLYVVFGGGSEDEDVSISVKLDRAATEAEDRFSESELEKIEVREQVNRAAVVSRGELDEVKSEILARVEELRAMLEKEEPNA